MENENGQKKMGELSPVNIPIQMLSLRDTMGRITPIRFRFQMAEDTVETMEVQKVISHDEKNYVGIREKQFICSAKVSDGKGSWRSGTMWGARNGRYSSSWHDGWEDLYFPCGCKQRLFKLERFLPGECAGEKRDLRSVPSIVGGDQEKRHGIVLAKSTPAKKYGIQTGEAIVTARQKCPELVVVPPDYGLYVKASRAFMGKLKQYCDNVIQYSIDEAWCVFDGFENLYGRGLFQTGQSPYPVPG